MPFKINISDKGKTLKKETENEVLIGMKIGEKLAGKEVSEDLDGYQLEITGTSDIAGFAGKKGLEGTGMHRQLLTYGFGMKNKKIKGLRKRKSLRGEAISSKTVQINTIVLKEGKNKFADLTKPAEKIEEAVAA